ncbi:hypothetical protein DENIS_2843 [Desulfonema ishimotonii]|uniref:STAS domain-containing protein n=1 Tax=Desulfonema ishimotonii TaxID=45657 RepID=A0A401FY39_9BACT|nr:hypothetical protein [Desulfonema ishimotonii]GBC61881.1 hypothetical protein DENIS_2843 [Desulfonema ishimotonii]
MKNFNMSPLFINVNRSGDRTLMSWVGQSSDRNPSLTLNSYLDSLVDDLKGRGELTIRFSQLEYMNSSTVPPIIQFMKKLDAGDVKTVITYNPASKWQSASFKALETLTMMMRNVTVRGE